MELIDFAAANLSFILTLVATGVLAGLLAGLLGVGGGIVIVPVLFFLLQRQGVSAPSAMLVATATSLATMIPTSISSIRAHNLKGNVDTLLLKRWAPFIVAGVLGGSLLVTELDGRWLTLLFAIIAMLAALNMLFRTGKAAMFAKLPGRAMQRLMGGGIGFFSAMVGIGGGTISVPLLTLCSYPAHRAVGTAAAIGLLIALPGALTMLLFGTTPTDAPIGTLGLVNLPGFLCIVPLTVLFAPIGAALGARLDGAKLKKVFALVLLITGGRMLWQLLPAL
ncbi:sulfite exporter TauE/SafE family protein [Shewanella sp. JM162201]|uniref:Probable membrane transporter protein n=1 Tax=Shewanella jiangmenensis TaxID=2837387 RepID=A0ABS5V270_9GAMM|nr:sulfite exporter TauE/SafE family protein [Shewanella jiangmenensis]MBT1444020.1 sulfite exporter TauE/SafE family protein [Shewanella jiangmenensis]